MIRELDCKTLIQRVGISHCSTSLLLFSLQPKKQIKNNYNLSNNLSNLFDSIALIIINLFPNLFL